MIKHLEDVGGYYEGNFYSPLFEADMVISLENNTFIEYAEKCVEHFNSLSDDKINLILEKCIEFFNDMYEQYADDYGEDCNPDYLTVENVLGDYIEGISISISTPQNNDILAYNVEILCPIDCPVCSIKGDEIVYIGENMDLSPWDNFDDAEKNYIKE